MNTDIRIAIGLTSNPKVLKLMKRCGDRSFFCLISLWTWAAQNRPDGNLEGMDAEDVELSSKWTGAEGCFIGCLKDLRFIDQEPDGSFSIHDWAENNPWAAEAKERSEAARLSRLFRKNPGAAQMLKTQGRVGITPDEYQLYVRETKEERTKYDRTANPSTPAPVPVPAPDPEPTPKEVCTKALLKAFCAEPQKDEVQAPQQNEPPLIVFPLSKKGEEQAFYQNDIDQWRESFPGVDLRIELLKCRQWNIDNPTKRKTRSGIRTHISSWLGKAQNGQQGVNATSGRNSKVNVRDKAALLKSKTAEFLNGQNYIDNGENNESIGSGGNLLLEHQIP